MFQPLKFTILFFSHELLNKYLIALYIEHRNFRKQAGIECYFFPLPFAHIQ